MLDHTEEHFLWGILQCVTDDDAITRGNRSIFVAVGKLHGLSICLGLVIQAGGFCLRRAFVDFPNIVEGLILDLKYGGFVRGTDEFIKSEDLASMHPLLFFHVEIDATHAKVVVRKKNIPPEEMKYVFRDKPSV